MPLQQNRLFIDSPNRPILLAIDQELDQDRYAVAASDFLHVIDLFDANKTYCEISRPQGTKFMAIFR